MFRKLLNKIGIGAAAAGAAVAYAPYAQSSSNHIYNLLFCDDPRGYAAAAGQVPTPWQQALFARPADPATLQALAADPDAEGRVRMLAYDWLRGNGHPVPPKQLLGVIVEVALEGGLDTLAAFSDGGVRYINQTGKLAVFEGQPAVAAAAAGLLAAAQAIVDHIGPWDKPRLPPPPRGNIRLSFLVSDGLYFGEGPMAAMQSEPMSAPTIARATELLLLVVDQATAK